MPATHYVTLAAVAVASMFIGFHHGRHSAAPVASTDDSESLDDSDEFHADGDLNAVKAGTFEQCKMVLCVRTDLKMTPGKIAAQCGHATLACYKSLSRSNPALVRHWETTGQAKVALKCSSQEELLVLQAKAQSLNLCARAIQDAGRTEVEPGTLTVVGIGPGPVDLINQVTGKLRLL